MKKIILATVVIILILLNTTAYLILYKKYNDIVDFFNQDSQLTTERIEAVDAGLKSLKAKVDEMAVQAPVDDKLRSYQDRVENAVDEIKRTLTSKVDSLASDVSAIKEKVGIKRR